MSEYTEADLPVDIHHGEVVTLADGTPVRFEGNGEAKDVFLDDGFERTVELFPTAEYTFDRGGKTFKLTAGFDDTMKVEVV